jgi:diguanylate cyclase (GGDEF)-like protein
VNDTYGHLVGDRALKEAVIAIRGVSRDADDIIRWGGDEFIGIYRGMTVKNLTSMQERIRKALSNIEIQVDDKKISVSASMGMSFFQESDESYIDVIQRADEALYLDKVKTHSGVGQEQLNTL